MVWRGDRGKLKNIARLGRIDKLPSQLFLDGAVLVLHPNGLKARYSLDRLTRLYDGIDQLEDEAWNHVSEGGMIEDTDDQGMWYQADDGGDDWIQPLESQSQHTQGNGEEMETDEEGDWSDEANADDSRPNGHGYPAEDEWETETIEADVRLVRLMLSVFT